MEKLTIAQAAPKLGLSQDTVRRRLKTGELAGERLKAAGGFRWMVNVDDDTEAEQSNPPVAEDNDLVNVLKGQVQSFQDQLTERAKEISALHQEIGELHQLLGVKALEAAKRPWWRFWQ